MKDLAFCLGAIVAIAVGGSIGVVIVSAAIHYAQLWFPVH